MSSNHPKRLIVESPDDVGVVTGLMRHHVQWDTADKGYAVFIQSKNSADEALDKEFLSTMIKSSGLRVLGLLLDADVKFDSRWGRIKAFCKPRFPSVPDKMPDEGLILEDADGLRFGAWIMPDNKSHGMLENFCSLLVPDTCKAHWEHADASYKEARVKGAPWRDAHAVKAHIHTWLAWQDPPGERLGVALNKKMLNPASDSAKPFVGWIKNLYGLPALEAVHA